VVEADSDIIVKDLSKDLESITDRHPAANTLADDPAYLVYTSATTAYPKGVLQFWQERSDISIYDAVGMSESSCYLCETKLRPIRPGSAGFPQPGHDIQLLDPDTLLPAEVGQEGMICVPDTDPGLFI
jgi:acetyl-CoA synthetase